MMAMNENSRFVVICGARAHFGASGNHDMTVTYDKYPSGTADIAYYSRDIQVDFYDTFSIYYRYMDKDFKISDCYNFTPDRLHKLYKWLANKPNGKLLVKLAKQNTIQVK